VVLAAAAVVVVAADDAGTKPDSQLSKGRALRAPSLFSGRMPMPNSESATALPHAVPTNLVHTDRLPLIIKITNLIAIIVPFLALFLAIIILWGHGFSWSHLAMLLGMYFATGFGITVGFHRLFTHRSFETSRPVKFVLAVLGSMAVQGPVLRWVATHRRHHQHSDHDDDPHSPHLHGHGIRGMFKGLWHAHMGWILAPEIPNLTHYVGDFRKDRLIQTVSKLFPLWVVIGLIIPTAIGGLWTMSWFGALLGLIWGGLVRVFFVHHVTWSINSACHFWGSRPFDCGDESRNNFLFGILAWGEGWHNNHHAFPTSARHGLRWWQFDLSYQVIRLLKMLHLVWSVRIPSKEGIAARQLRSFAA
jgi:stearoyl-CoA desaturase (delta-9 desaturase)